MRGKKLFRSITRVEIEALAMVMDEGERQNIGIWKLWVKGN